ncbi:hypothetical protein HYU11_03480 [Candidatus Woesearchaeota archaeon]|nr:hypothetical protein [Candidatus Woesearchaeota archaeon]
MKAQTWSTDAVIAVVIFMLASLSFFYITGKSTETKKLDALAAEAARIPDLFSQSSNNTLGFIENNRINKEKLDNLTAIDYQQIKSQLGLINDFCIHFEDENGNVIFINLTNNITGIGNCRI